MGEFEKQLGKINNRLLEIELYVWAILGIKTERPKPIYLSLEQYNSLKQDKRFKDYDD